MPIHFKPILTLAFLSAFLPELLSTNVSLGYFFNPVVFLVLLTLTYGIPVLIIRELSVRYKLGVWSIFLLGAGYGLYNEGLHALTLFSPHPAGIEVFEEYGVIYGFRIPLILAFCAWHGAFSVVAPIYFTHYLFKDSAEKSWIHPKILWILSSTALALSIFNFVNSDPRPFMLIAVHTLVILGMWLFLWNSAERTAGIAPIDHTLNTYSMKAFWTGVLIHLTFFIIPLILASMRIPMLMYIIYFAIVGTLLYRWTKKQPAFNLTQIVLAGLGGYTALTLTIYLPVSLLSGNIFALGLLSVFLLTFWFIIRKIRKSSYNN